MGALGGVLSRQGHEVDPGILASLSMLQAQIGPDGEHVATDRGLLCLHRPLVTERGRCTQRPFHAENGDLLVWNGRLDNDDELAADLGLTGPPHLAAEALVHAALERWDVEALPRLVGDFSLSLWQPRSRRLLLATDVWGLRPVFVHQDGDRIAWASRCRALVDALDLPREPDPHFVANFLIRPRSDGHSPFARIDKLPAAHYLEATPKAVRHARYWAPDPSREIRYRRDEELEERFLHLLRQAVACRLSASGPVFAELSGGYDSSAISCLGDQLVREGRVPAPELETLSYVFDRAPSADERRYIEPVEAMLGRTGTHIDNEQAPLLSVPPAVPSFRPDYPSGQLIYCARNQAVADRMAGRGARVLLRGMGGDHVTWGDPGLAPWEVGDHLRRGSWRQALRATRAWSMSLQTPLHQTLWRGGIWPLLPAALRRRTYGFALPVEGWFQPGFADGLDLRSWTLGVDDDVGFRRPSQRQHFAAIREVAAVVGWEFLVHHGSVECRFPFLDRRLVELALATPIERMLRPDETRSLARRAMHGRMPEPVRMRPSKAGPDEVVYRTVTRRWPELSALLADPLVSRHGFVDRDRFRTTCQRVRHGVRTVAPQLTRTFALEFWLRSLDCPVGSSQRPSVAPPVRVEPTTKEVVHEL